jgi:hypothetical protein
MPGIVGSGVELAIGHSIAARGGFTRLTMQSDGNLVLYARRAAGEVARWASGTNGQPITACIMQTDGNLVLYSRPTATSCCIADRRQPRVV